MACFAYSAKTVAVTRSAQPAIMPPGAGDDSPHCSRSFAEAYRPHKNRSDDVQGIRLLLRAF